MVGLAVNIGAWNAWAPGIADRNDRLIDCGNPPVPGSVPKAFHRRLSPLAKAVFNVAGSCLPTDKAMPVVFSSAHGEICKSLRLLQTIQTGQELSPTSFSLSVHNAIAGLFSIAFNMSREITVLAPGQEGIAPAFIEALGILQEGAEEVLAVLYDEPIADFYPTDPYDLSAPFPCVLAVRLTLGGEGEALELVRTNRSREDGEHPVQLTSFIRFLLSDERSLSLGNKNHCWTWQKK